MSKVNLLLIALLMLLSGCEIKRTGSSTGLFGRLTGRDTTQSSVLSITPNASDSAQVAAPTVETMQSAPAPSMSNLYEIETPLGNMTIRLFDETPQHRDNFKKLVAAGFYDGTMFHRVIKNFMIQGGDPNSTDGDPYNDGAGGPGYTTPAEFHRNLYHKKGALAAARQPDPVNPQRRSSGSQFYIVHGRPFGNEELTQIERSIGAQTGISNFAFSPEARQTYETVGGAPFLDMQYTVFGELIDGFDVLDRIAATPTEAGDRPATPVPMNVRPVLVQ